MEKYITRTRVLTCGASRRFSLLSLCRPPIAGVLGVLATLLSGSAFAQAEVRLYGLLDVSLRYDHTRDTSVVSLGSGLSRGSRFGWRSQESLDLGWKVSTMGEAGLSVDDGQVLTTGSPTPGFGRQLWIGLGHASAGTFALGRQYTPLFAMAAGALDPLGANYLGAIPTTLALQGGMTARVSNALTYSWGYGNAMDSPAPRDRFSISAMFAPKDKASGRHGGIAIGYGSGPWFVGYAIHRTNANFSDMPIGNGQQTAQIFGGGYRMGRVQWLGSLHRTWSSRGVDRINRSVGMSVSVPSGQVIAQFLQSKDQTSRGQDTRNLSLTIEHAMSSRTVAYATYARNLNSAASAVALYQSPISVVAMGSSPTALALGLRTSF